MRDSESYRSRQQRVHRLAVGQGEGTTGEILHHAAMIDAELKTDIVDGACYNETFVDVRRTVPQGEG